VTPAPHMLPLVILAAGSSALVPDMMTAAYKKGILPCFTPFSKCVHTRQVPTPKPGHGQALVQVGGSSVNPCDVDYLELGFGCSGGGGTLGMDLSGTVVSTGSGCDRLKVGDEVWADTGGVKGDTGGMAQYAVANCEQTGVKPKSLNFTEAGTIPLVGYTALEMWQKTGAPWAQTNLTVVVTSGTGGTGFIGVQLAKALGATRVVTSTRYCAHLIANLLWHGSCVYTEQHGATFFGFSGAANIALAKRLGADVVIGEFPRSVLRVPPRTSCNNAVPPRVFSCCVLRLQSPRHLCSPALRLCRYRIR
jgi:threonine dehydrogenase-like Zn-dependent dehydrogenase